MPDMLVNLYKLDEDMSLYQVLEEKGILIKRVLSPDKSRVLDFIKDNFSIGWVNECEAALSNHPITCYVAVKEKEIVGFACYDATAKNYFGPTGVKESLRGQKIGEALLKKSLNSMKEDGYGYGIIGWVEEALVFYEKKVGAIIIEDSYPGIYERLLDH